MDAETPPSAGVQSSEQIEQKSSFSLSDSTDVLSRYFHWTVGFFLLILLVSPVVAYIDESNFDSIDFHWTSFMTLFLGPLGIVSLIISWYWFIGYHKMGEKLKAKEGLSTKVFIYLNLFFMACLLGVALAFFKGRILPWDVDCGCTTIVMHLSGYYIYAVLILYLMSFSIILRRKAQEKTQLAAAKILSAVSLLATVIFTIIYNPYVNRSLIDNSQAIQKKNEYALQQEKWNENLIQFNKAYATLFQTGDTYPFIISCNETYSYCDGLRYKLSYNFAIPPDYEVLSKYIEEVFPKYLESYKNLSLQYRGEYTDYKGQNGICHSANQFFSLEGPYSNDERYISCICSSDLLQCHVENGE